MVKSAKKQVTFKHRRTLTSRVLYTRHSSNTSRLPGKGCVNKSPLLLLLRSPQKNSAAADPQHKCEPSPLKDVVCRTTLRKPLEPGCGEMAVIVRSIAYT